MNLDSTPSPNGLERQVSHGYASSGSDSTKQSISGKIRPSRAGTRSVSTLSAAQLERKRANDREAQRVIRQRTKDHIEHLEKIVDELRRSHELNENLVAIIEHRNHELEEENVFLRGKLNEAGYQLSIPRSESQHAPDIDVLSVHTTIPSTQASGSSIQRPDSTPTARSLSVRTNLCPNSRHGSFQQGSTYVPNAPHSALVVQGVGMDAATRSLTTWKSHDGIQRVLSARQPVPDSAQGQPANLYSPVEPQKVDWESVKSGYQYNITHEPPTPGGYDQPHPPPPPPPGTHQQPQYVQQPPPQSFSPVSVQTYQHPPPPPLPQTQFQGISDSHHATHQVQRQPTCQHPVSYTMQTSEYISAHSQMQPPALPTSSYHQTPNEQSYTLQHIHPPALESEEHGVIRYSTTNHASG